MPFFANCINLNTCCKGSLDTEIGLELFAFDVLFLNQPWTPWVQGAYFIALKINKKGKNVESKGMDWIK